MGKLALRLASCERALKTFDEILQEPFTIIVRDASIQRFEYTFESLWKLLQTWLREEQGVRANSPKQAFRETQSVGFLTASDTAICLKMTDDRNLTSHTYIEKIAESIYKRLPDYNKMMWTIFQTIEADSAKPNVIQ